MATLGDRHFDRLKASYNKQCLDNAYGQDRNRESGSEDELAEVPVAAPKVVAQAPCSTSALEAEFKKSVDNYVSFAAMPEVNLDQIVKFKEELRLGDKRIRLHLILGPVGSRPKPPPQPSSAQDQPVPKQ